MELFRRYFSKRYFKFFLMFFVVLYLGSFCLVNLYMASPQVIFYVSIVVYGLFISGLISYLYFRKSLNDWNDRFFVAFGWVILGTIFSAILIKPIYGGSWTSIINWTAISSNWLMVLVMFSASFLAKIRRSK